MRIDDISIQGETLARYETEHYALWLGWDDEDDNNCWIRHLNNIDTGSWFFPQNWCIIPNPVANPEAKRKGGV